MTKEEREVMEMALDALVDWNFTIKPTPDEDIITAMKKCLANDALEKKAENARELGLDYEPEQEPDKNIESLLEAYWHLAFDEGKTGKSHGDAANEVLFALRYLYTTPPQRTWVGLTKKEFQEAVEGLEDLEDCWVAIEGKLKEKNT